MIAYLKHTKRIAADTPSTRNRVADLWRVVAILGVVFGHWLAASIWTMPDGEIAVGSLLESVPHAGWITWVVQVMPVFFLVGGYASARALTRVVDGEVTARDWVIARARRLFTPVVPLLVVWTVLIVAMNGLIPADVLHAGVLAATMPLWFMAVYLVLTALAPITHRWWRSAGLSSVVVLGLGAVTVDLLRFATGADWIGFVNFLLVWAAVHQVGYWWAERGTVPARQGAMIAAGSLVGLVVVTSMGWYPVAMLGIPGVELTNMTPPTAAIGLLGVAQAGVIWWSAGPVARFAARARVWHNVVSVSGVTLTLYLWHLTAMALVAAGGLFAFDGVIFAVEPGTAVWWLTRPLWMVVLAAVTLIFLAWFARFEWRVSRAPAPGRVILVAGVVLAVAASAAVALFGLASPAGEVNWMIPVVGLAGALLVGAVPRRKRAVVPR